MSANVAAARAMVYLVGVMLRCPRCVALGPSRHVLSVLRATWSEMRTGLWLECQTCAWVHFVVNEKLVFTL